MIIIIKETAAGRSIYCKDVKGMRYGQTGEDAPQYTDRLRCAFYPSGMRPSRWILWMS